jgi:crotonobetainyl-CoA:carnitine CoA-transferase CaiB-like acyl-CoA transferase
MGEAVADPQVATRGVIHHHDSAAGTTGSFGVPLAAFMFVHDGPRIDTPPPRLGEHNEEIFAELGVAGRRAARSASSSLAERSAAGEGAKNVPSA